LRVVCFAFERERGGKKGLDCVWLGERRVQTGKKANYRESITGTKVAENEMYKAIERPPFLSYQFQVKNPHCLASQWRDVLGHTSCIQSAVTCER
jgi:hypothetical protein